MEQLLVRLGTQHHEPIQWLVYSDTENEVIASGELPDAGELATLSERAGQRAVIALAPTSEVLLTWVTLPPRAGRKVLSAIPFMLEDELASDISEQFFALGPRQGDRQAVAVVRRELLNDWQQWMRDADLFCDTIIPDVLAVPHQEGCWSLLSMGQDLLLREDTWKGLQGEETWILPAFSHLVRQQEAPVRLINYSDLDVSGLSNVSVEQAPLELPMQVLATQATATKFNLLQGEFKIKRKRSGVLELWRLPLILLALVLVTSLVDKSVSLYQLNQKKDALSAQIDETIKAGFPDIGLIRNVRSRIGSEMARLELGGGGASMLVMLEQLKPAFATSKVRPQTLRFDASRTEIRMQAKGQNFDALEQFRRQAESAGFNVEQGAINNQDNAVIGNISIRSQS